MSAAINNSPDMVALLLKSKANADLPDNVRRGHGHVGMGVG